MTEHEPDMEDLTDAEIAEIALMQAACPDTIIAGKTVALQVPSKAEIDRRMGLSLTGAVEKSIARGTGPKED